MDETLLTKRRYKDGDSEHRPWQEEIFIADTSHQCPTYVHRTPPCQGSCPSGEDIRGWLNIARGLEKPPEGMSWQDYAFARIVDSNPFPAIMGRVCPAPCEDGCNRNEVEDHVGINAVEQFIGDYGLEHGLKLHPAGPDTGKKVAIIGSGPASLACAYQLRRKGHACTLFESRDELGGMMRYGIPGYRTPRDVLDGEIQRILDLGVEVRTNTRIGVDISLEELEAEFDAVFVGLGAQSGAALPIPGGAASNCISGVSFLAAFNDGRLTHSAKRVVVIGGGDTAMDVATVARRLGHIGQTHEKDRPEFAVLGHTARDVATVARRQGAEVKVFYREAVEQTPASQKEIEHALQEGVEIRSSLTPVELVLGDDGRATAVRLVEVEWNAGKMEVREGSEFDIECDLVVAAIGQACDFTGMESLDNGRGSITADKVYRVRGRDKLFAGGDVLRPHLLTTAIGHASIAAEGIDDLLRDHEPGRRPKVDVHHYKLLDKLRETGLEPSAYDHQQVRGTDSETYAVHNYEDRSHAEIVPSDELFLGHFAYAARNKRGESQIDPVAVLGHFGERIEGLSEETAACPAACAWSATTASSTARRMRCTGSRRTNAPWAATSRPTTSAALAAISAPTSARPATSRWVSGSKSLRGCPAILGLLALLGVAAFAPPSQTAELSGVPLPEITKGKGRRNHMKLLDHQRDETLREGIRGLRFSLKECVACHAVPGADGTPVAAGDSRHFCSACHLYTAVRIDCFECHASRPEAPAQARAPNPTRALSMIGRDWK
jgi:NADPH-dependent glutamate synthase beta subunit-like oxidoreductase